MTSFLSSPARSKGRPSPLRESKKAASSFGSSITSNVSSKPLYTTPKLTYSSIHLEERTPTMDCVSNAPNGEVEVEREFFRMNVSEMAREEAERRREEIENEKRRVEEFDRRLRARLKKQRADETLVTKASEGAKREAEKKKKMRDKVRLLREGGAGAGARAEGKGKGKGKGRGGGVKKGEAKGELEDVTPVKVVQQSFVTVEVPTPKEFVTPTKKARERMLRHKK
ncbi:hypothetical protein TrVE_jg7366 [Triparma verrucosa]|uniref:Uncharacterized protein n=1 Tax=Triparma verrucosa TaxID=1606542 RepID=A0A9W7BGZ6_9STRA|nr:hypothetical protein TrVE_jg7366 [Triparma verrucosa]